MPQIDEQKLFDVGLDDPREHSIDHLEGDAGRKLDAMNDAQDKVMKEEEKSEPDESLLGKLRRAAEAALESVNEAQRLVLLWWDADNAAQRAAETQGKHVDAVRKGKLTQEQREARMRAFAHQLPTFVILENLAILRQQGGESLEQRIYVEELRRRYPPPTGPRPSPVPAPGPRQPRDARPEALTDDAEPRTMEQALALYRDIRSGTRDIQGGALIDEFVALTEADGNAAIVRRRALRNEIRVRARAIDGE